MTTIYLIRHGETAWNAGKRFQGHQDTPLSEVGRAQAAATARALASRRFDACYTSDLSRAMETAQIVAAPHALLPKVDPRLREAYFGEWEGLLFSEVAERWPEVVAAWRADSLRTRPPGGETVERMQQRVTAALEEIIARHPDGEVLIVGHGGSARAIIAFALGGDLALYPHLRLDNCSISVIHADGGHRRLVHLNDICHLGPGSPHATLDEGGGQVRQAG